MEEDQKAGVESKEGGRGCRVRSGEEMVVKEREGMLHASMGGWLRSTRPAVVDWWQSR